MDEEQLAMFHERMPGEPVVSGLSYAEIAQAFFFENADWEPVDDIHARLRAMTPRLGYATVYRVMRVLEELGFAERRTVRNEREFRSRL